MKKILFFVCLIPLFFSNCRSIETEWVSKSNVDINALQKMNYDVVVESLAYPKADSNDGINKDSLLYSIRDDLKEKLGSKNKNNSEEKLLITINASARTESESNWMVNGRRVVDYLYKVNVDGYKGNIDGEKLFSFNGSTITSMYSIQSKFIYDLLKSFVENIGNNTNYHSKQ